jgi:cell volume regulation protein A
VSDPVTVFLLVVAGLLVVGTLGERVFVRTGVPAVIWLIALGLLVRVVDIVPAAVVTGLAPFFAALALVIILFDAGTQLSGADEGGLTGPDLRRAQLLGFSGFAATVVVVALFSQLLYGLDILPTWSWAHAFMLGSLVACGASEVFLPSLEGAGVRAELGALLRRESAITKALAVTGTVICLDLLSPRVETGGAGLAMLAGFGFALAFGSVAGIAWIVALQRPHRRHRRRAARGPGASTATPATTASPSR